MIAWTLPQRRSGAAAPAQPHNHPSKTNLAARGFSEEFKKVAQEAIEAESRLVSSGLWKDVCEEYKMTKEGDLQRVLDGIDDSSSQIAGQDEDGGQDAVDFDLVHFDPSDLDQYVDYQEEEAAGDDDADDYDGAAAKRALIEQHHWHFREQVDDRESESDDERNVGARKRARV